MNGFLLADKPQSFTSFDVVALCRRIFHTKKIGHSGTLDPFATGLLILALGEGTKLLEYLPHSPKVYSGEGVLGSISDTLDCDGTVEKLYENNDIIEKISPDMIKKCVQQKLTGRILQTPPKYSAVKVQGVRAYARARRGESFTVSPREAEVFDFSLQSLSLPIFSFRCSVSSGTYIRSLIATLGEVLGVGAYTRSLRREAIGDFSLRDAVTIDTLQSYSGDLSSFLLPLDRVGRLLARVNLSRDEHRRLANGLTIEREAISSDSVFSGYCDDIFVGILEYVPEKGLKFRKMLHTN